MTYKFIFKIFVGFFFILFSIFFSLNLLIYFETKNYVIEDVEFLSSNSDHKDFALILGASVRKGVLSSILKARMDTGILLYQKKLVPTLLLSGDGTDNNYNETSAMKKYALKMGVPEQDLIIDEKGYNTYETMARAHDVFDAKSAYIISQRFHLMRSVWIARHLGVDAVGVSAGESLSESWYYSLREFGARAKDFLIVYFVSV